MAEAGCPVDRGFFHVLRCSAAVGGGFAPEHGVILCHNRLHTRREVLNAMTHELIHAYDHCRYGDRIGGEPSASASSADCGCSENGVNRGGDGGGTSASGAAGSSVDVMHSSGGCSSSNMDSSRGPGGSEGSGVSSGGGSGSSDGGGVGGWARRGGLDWSDCRQHACTEIRAANLSGDCSLLQELLRGNLPLLPLGWGAQQRACVARRAALSVAMSPACEGGREAAAAVVAEMMPTCLADTAPFDPSEAVAAPTT